MSQLSGNSCSIITLLPLGVECESINASTPISANGLISIFITGGTPPYTTTWSNGSQGSYIFNLLPGSYTATTTDYYKDFTATTVCTVGASSFYLDKFENCSNSSQYVYYLAKIPTTYVVNKIYKLQSLDGCWKSNGQVLFSNQTYFNTSATTIAGPYDLCVKCLPPPTPPEIKPASVCMTITESGLKPGTSVVTNVQFSSASTINGKISYTSSTNPYVIFYNSGTTKWNIQNWPLVNGVPTQNNSTLSPVGSWAVNGSSSVTISITDGACVTKPTINLKKTDVSCEGTKDGSVTINSANGTPPYQYSLDNVIYGSSNMYIGLDVGNYTAYVKDSNGQTESQSFNIISTQSPANYTVTLIQQPIAIPTVNNLGKFTEITNNIVISINPPLPTNRVVKFDLIHSVNMEKIEGAGLNPPIITPTLFYSFTTGSTTGGLITGYTSPTLNTTTSAVQTCDQPTNQYSTGYTEIFKVVLSGGSATITGTVVKKITTPDSIFPNCLTYGRIDDVFQITNISLINQSRCETLNRVVKSVELKLERTGTFDVETYLKYAEAVGLTQEGSAQA